MIRSTTVRTTTPLDLPSSWRLPKRWFACGPDGRLSLRLWEPRNEVCWARGITCAIRRSPIEKTVANINQDGGREGVIAEDIIANAVDISDMYQIVRDVMGKRGVSVMDRDRALRTLVGFSSDHYPFLLAGVPAIDLKPGHTVEGDWEIGLRDRQRYMYEWRHKPADNFDPDLFTMESVAEMAKRAVWLAWHISEMDGRPELKADHAMWRVRGRPEQPYCFGPERAFDE